MYFFSVHLQILDAYSAGTTAYKGMLSAYNLNPGKVNEVMYDVNEVSIGLLY